MKANYSNSVILNNEAVNTYVHFVKDHRDLIYDLREFLIMPLQLIMDNLKINRYLVGGTAALIMCYDIPIRKEIKDIDVIVPEGTIERIREQIKKSPFYSIVSEYKDYNHYNNSENSHIEIKCIQGFNVDIVETAEEIFNDMYRISPSSEGIEYCPLINILETKNKWRRPKDLDDLFFIEKWFETIGIGEIEEQKQRDLSDKIAIEEMKCQEPPETATFESINKMFDDLKEAEIEERLKDNAPYKIGDVITFIGENCATGKKEIVRMAPILMYNKKYSKITITDKFQHLITYKVEPWIAELLA